MLARLRSFLAAWTRRDRFEDALDEEVRFHLEACTEELVRAGVPGREAARRARVQFGGIAGVKDDCRRARGLRVADELERMMANIRLALRMLRPARPSRTTGNRSVRRSRFSGGGRR